MKLPHLKKLNTPAKIQDYLNSLPFNFEKKGETCMPVNQSLAAGRIHCFEGALIAAAALQMNGHKPLLLDLKTTKDDYEHVVALFQVDGYWGAISKTNHNVLRYREPIYKTVRELALSYFHEYFLHNGKKTMRSFSKPYDLSKFGTRWMESDEDVFDIAHDLDASPHTDILTKKQMRNLR
ncbi:MAG: hypothetical protein JWL80_62, partial [Parcubacteria group bacterium]|nr:hypothetical protein [Parcubacteria group bacterium]